MSVVLDLSNYDWETFDADCLKANGCTGVILGCQNPAVARQMAAGLRRAGLPIIGVYGFDYFGTPGDLGDTWDAIAIALENGVRRVWVDAEVDYRTTTPAGRVAEIRECVAAIEAAGLSAGIYTGGWWWPENTNNSTAFAHLPLWHAAYWDDRREVRTVNYGGWREVAVHQWTSTYQLCGRERDANYVFEEQAKEGDLAINEELKAQIAVLQSQMADVRAGVFQLQVQAFGEDAAAAGRADAYAVIGGTVLATNGQLATEIDDLRAQLRRLPAGGSMDAVLQAYADIGRQISMAGGAITKAGETRAANGGTK